MTVTFILIFFVTGAILHFYVSGIFETYLLKEIHKRTNLDIRFEKFKINVLNGNFYLSEVEVFNSGIAKTPILTVESVTASINIYALFAGNLWIHSAHVKKPVLSITRNRDKKVDILEIINRLKPEGSQGIKRFKFYNVQLGMFGIQDGRILFTDYSLEPPFKSELTDIAFAVKRFCRPVPAGGKLMELDFSAKAVKSGIGKIAISGRVNPVSMKENLDVEILIENVTLNAFKAYYNPGSPIIINSGKGWLCYTGKCRNSILDGRGRIELKNVVVMAKPGFISPELFGVAVEKVVNYVVEHQEMVFNFSCGGNILNPEFKLAPGEKKVIIKAILDVLDVPEKAVNNIKESIETASESVSKGIKKIHQKIADTVNEVIDVVVPD